MGGSLAVATLFRRFNYPHPVHTLASPSTADVQADSPVLRLRLDTCAYVLALQCLVMALPILKLVGVAAVASWSWLWVLVPVWGPGALLTVMIGAERLVEVLQGLHTPKAQLVVSQPS
jgi:hypothetical protein